MNELEYCAEFSYNTIRMKKGFITLITALAIGTAIWTLTVLFSLSLPGKILELKSSDYLFYLRGSVPPPENIIIVAIDEPSFNELNLAWPWPRKIHAQLINSLKHAGARVIALDILFAEPSTKENDQALATAISAAGNVIVPAELHITDEHGYRQIAVTEPIPLLKEAARGAGCPTLLYDPDNFVRRSRLRLGQYNSLVYEIIKYSAKAELPVGNEDILINFVGPARTIKTVSYYQALADKKYLPAETFKDKIVFIGRALAVSPDPQAEQPDTFATPFYQTRMSGVEILANLTDTILRNRYIKEFTGSTNWLLLLLYLSLAVILIRISYLWGLLTTLFIIIGYGATTIWYFNYQQVLLPAFMPIIGLGLLYGSTSLTKYILVEQEKKYLRKAFQKYVPPSVVKKILAEPDKLKLGGEKVTGSVLFSDLASFTTFSEKLSPEELVSFLNEYLTAMTEIIFKHDGTITRFIGDAILAVWGAPIWHKDHARRACQAALQMKQKLQELNRTWKERGLPELGVRIGINTGPMVVGNMGSRQHFDYTAMGDSVNVASRLEGANKEYGTTIIISEYTRAQLPKTITCRHLDKIKVKGREAPLDIYELGTDQAK